MRNWGDSVRNGSSVILMGAASQPHASHSAGCCGMDVLLVPKARGPRWAGDTWGGNWQVLTRRYVTNLACVVSSNLLKAATRPAA